MLNMQKKIVFGIFFLLCLVISISLSPGSYSIDTWVQYRDMMSGEYYDWHSPILPFIWRKLYQLTGKMSILYWVQMFGFWILFFMIISLVKNYLVQILVTLFAFPLVIFAQYVMKDGQFAICVGISYMLILPNFRIAKYLRGIFIFFLL